MLAGIDPDRAANLALVGIAPYQASDQEMYCSLGILLTKILLIKMGTDRTVPGIMRDLS